MGNVKSFQGVIPPVSTLFNEQGVLDKRQMSWLIDHLIGEGVNGLFFLGTGGEFSQMSVNERKEVAEFAVSYVNKRVPVLIGTGSTSTREAIELSQDAERVGADGVVVINPYYWVLSDEHLFSYYDDIAKSVDLPVVLYNFPNLTGQDLSVDLVSKLADAHENIVAIKDTVDSVGHIRELIIKVKGKHPHFSVLCGFDDHLLNTLQLGGDGVISASGNFASQLSVGIYEAFRKGDLEKAGKLYKQLAILPLLYKIDSPFVNVIKEAMRLCGMDVSTYELPPTKRLSEEKVEQVKQVLEKANVLPDMSGEG
ncbi:dihydrodipicolinate synthase family protein [Halalkalibacter sp. APA_J-10(15)]|uniref:dihydrodipicolinate synthase family protein n=1 Tax=Halalkalibacter sp. APA_J-10(15) TaxID=2933805 RepID=UPI001FF2D3CD|nr:dihydrodipicolinate synthase family protein [Halalkalibacter sp. APA_J-10(15)]MCK0470534.1 dihydrodipicolinate synthase family protein [Halalkalibacter sp. APA_J-10(15)]